MSNGLLRLVETNLIRELSYEEYRDRIRDIYDGLLGEMLPAVSQLSLHPLLVKRLLSTRKFDLTGAKQILDIGCGAGQLARHLLKFCDAGASIVCCDLSFAMLRRSRLSLRSSLPDYLCADLTRLPFMDSSFDCVTCGYVLEHIPDAVLGLTELARVLKPGGRMLLLTSEDTFAGACTSRVWRCRTYNRQELRRVCKALRLTWKQELWFSKVHRLLRSGGICASIEKPQGECA